ncbi:MAG: autotransporter-associated beta strand repeat-containing protein [Verrucomicrobiota bacterium]
MKRLIFTIIATLGLNPGSWAANLVWTPSTADWDLTTTNWKDTNSLATVAFAQGDSVLFDDSGTGQSAVALGANLLSPNSVLVDSSSQYSFASTTGGKLTGGLSLVKRGTGLLILDADNAISGPTSIEAGVLQIGNGAGRGTLGSSSVSNGAALVVNRTGTSTLTGDLSGAGTLTNVAGTLIILGTNNMSGLISVNAGTLTLSNAPAAGNSTEVIINATVGTAGTRLLLAGGVSFSGAATVKCLNTSSSLNMRCNLLGNPGTNSFNGPILCSGDGLVQLNGTGAGEFVVASGISVNPDDVTPFNGQILLRGSGVGKLTGTVNTPNAFVNKSDAGNWTIYSTGNSWSATALNVGLLRLGANNALPTTLALQVGQSSSAATFDLAGFDQQIATLNLAPSLSNSTNTIANSSTTSDSVLTISNGGVYGGLIQDAISNGTRKVGLTITGGAQQLSGNCTYSGPTTIRAGGVSLAGSGSISNTATIEIGAGAPLDASRRTDGTLWLGAAQTLKGDGTFNIVGNLASQGTIELKLNKSGDTLANDKIQVPASYQVTYGGTLKLDLTGDPLAATDSFKLFDAPTYSGAFITITPPTPGTGLAWNINTLTTDGTLRIDVSIPTNPTNITFTVVAGGTQMELAWPEIYTGWTLQGQTNAPSVGLTTNWFDVPDSAATNRVFLPIDPVNGSVFYRLRYQP